MTSGSSDRRAALLTIDCGNSTFDLRLATARGDGLRRERQVELDLSRFLGDERPEIAVAASVRADRFRAVESALGELAIEVRRAGQDLPCPLELRYPDPSELGVDRWVGALAAMRRYGDSLVVDCGTAVTWNLVRADGVFLGGAIGLGLRSQLHGLAERTPALPPVDEKSLSGADRFPMPAVTTAGSLQLGSQRAFVHAVAGLASELVARAGLRTVRLVITGGDAELVLARGGREVLSGDVVHEPELVHLGLADLARRELGLVEFGPNGIPIDA